MSQHEHFDPDRYREELARQCDLNAHRISTFDSEIILDPHQSRAMSSVVSALEAGDSAFSVVHPGGSGKTVIQSAILHASAWARETVEELSDTQDIILAVERSLLGTIMEHMEDVGLDFGVWGAGERSVDRPLLVSTVQALQKNMSGLGRLINPDRISLVVGDEADKILTKARGDLLETFQNAQRIGFTATPEWPDGRHISSAWGEIVDQMDLREGILKGINVPPMFTLFEVDFDADDLKLEAGDFQKKSLDAALKAAQIELAIPEAYERMVPKGLRKAFPTLVYVPSVLVLDRVTRELRRRYGHQGLNISAWCSSASDSEFAISNSRMFDEIGAFQRGEIDLMVLCEMGGRGINLPRARCIIDAYPTLSANKLEQRHSRVLRRVREGTPLHAEGFEKPFAHIAQIIPGASKFRPITLLDILDCWPDYKPGKVLLNGSAHGAPLGLPIGQGAPWIEEVEQIVSLLLDGGGGLRTRLTLVEKADVLKEISLREKLPMADMHGFLILKNVKYGSVHAWADLLDISDNTIADRLSEAKKLGVTGRTFKHGRTLVNGFYSEEDAREVCADLLVDVPKAGKDGFFYDDSGEKFGPVEAWAREFSLSDYSVSNRFGLANMVGITAKSTNGHILEKGFHSESVARSACADLLVEMPKAGKDGFFDHDRKRYGSRDAWAIVLGLAVATVIRRLRAANISGINGKTRSGRVSELGFYLEQDVRKVCADLLVDMPNAEKDGFFVKDGERHGSISAWARLFRIFNQRAAVKSGLLKAGKKGVSAIDANRHLRVDGFYSESDVSDICKAIVAMNESKTDLPTLNEDGVFLKDGVRHAPPTFWARSLPISAYVLKKSLEGSRQAGCGWSGKP
ncbi:DEAD/DEAH box helicase family protein [Candidatus Gracilibacteria bacterium]|nr:DEAD/DEAH box helicase family protein [Candidatus Gracilibacteria bacterium]